MKGYYIDITNNLLDPKHRVAMKESVWLFMWFLDKMTSISEEGIGLVLGGKPIKYKEVYKDLGISIRTYVRWLNKLKKAKYINVKRTPYGCVISVNKAKKRFGRKVKNGKNNTKDYIAKVRKKMSEDRKGKKHYNWKGGITPKNKIIRMSLETRDWRDKVFERDNYTCQKCKIVGGKLEAHHIKQFAKFPKLRFVVDNGLTLCAKCHKEIQNMTQPDMSRMAYHLPNVAHLNKTSQYDINNKDMKIKNLKKEIKNKKAKLIKKLTFIRE